MEAVIYNGIPDYAKEIRHKVFVTEQGFRDEFDEIDDMAAHIVLFDKDSIPVATCRVFWDAAMNSYILGRLAVVKEYRGRNIGAATVKEAEHYVQKKNGKYISLHAQCRVAPFYKKMGFTEFGNIEDEQGCPHIWMRKCLAL